MLAQYGTYEACEYGRTVSFPIGEPGYMAPETVARGPSPERSGPKVVY